MRKQSLIAASFMALGSALTYLVMKKETDQLTESHEKEINKTQASWFHQGFKDGWEGMKREQHYDLIKRGLIDPED